MNRFILTTAFGVCACVGLFGQSVTPDKIGKKFGITTANEVFQRTAGVELTKKQYFKIAEGIKKREQDLFDLLNANRKVQGSSSKSKVIMQTELDGFVGIIGEGAYKELCIARWRMEGEASANQYYHRQKGSYVVSDSSDLINLYQNFLIEQEYLKARYRYSGQLRKSKLKLLKAQLTDSLEGYRLEEGLVERFLAKYQGVKLSDNEVTRLNRLYRLAFSNGVASETALALAADSLLTSDQKKLVKEEKVKSQIRGEVDWFIDNNDLPQTMRQPLRELYRACKSEKHNGKGRPLSKENRYKILRFRRIQLLLEHGDTTFLPADDLAIVNHTGLLEFSGELKVTPEQREQWLDYYLDDLTVPGVYPGIAENTKHFSRHLKKCKAILNEEQYNKFLMLSAKPGALEMAQVMVDELNANGQSLSDADVKLIRNYYLARKIAVYRYSDNVQKREVIKRNIHRHKSPRLSYLFVSLTKKDDSGAVKYRGTYHW